MTICAKAMRVAFVMFGLFATPAWCAGPVLTPGQIQAAIQKGNQYKSADQFLEKGLKGKRIKIAGAMARDGISKYATFFNDWQFVAVESAAAHQQMRELTAEEVRSKGLLHVFVEVRGGGVVGVSRIDRRYQGGRAHLVLKAGDRILQPIDKNMRRQSNDAAASLLWGATMRKITLDFAFDVSPADLDSPVTVILIDGDGNKHEQKADLKGVLNVD
jgi:hypothetical protein